MAWCLIHKWMYQYDHDARRMVRVCASCHVVEKV